MATRSLTDVFLLMRNNAARSRHIYPDQDGSERMHLVSLNEIEEGLGDRNENRMPPNWIDYLEKAQMILPKLKTKINELKMLHSRHLHRSTFDESSTDEIAIENCTHDISRLFNEGHRLVQIIKSHSSEGVIKEQRLAVNVFHSLGSALQELSTFFRTTQNSYLRQIQSREDRSKIYFDNPLEDDDLYQREGDEIDNFFVNSKQMNQQQLLMLEEENTKYTQEREQEVNAIVKSIVDLNEIFKDLSQMVSDQGTVLDRIDYNVEQTQIQVFEGFKQLRKADAYQKKNRKMCAIIILAVTIIIFFILIIIKS